MCLSSGPEKPWFVPIIRAFLCSDCADAVGSPAAFARDFATVSRRVASEGESFLTKTLPAFGRVIDSALQERGLLSQTFFKRRSKGSALPAFLQGLLIRVFEDDGSMKAQPCIRSIRLLRQACFWFKKLERGYSEKTLQQAIIDLIEVDEALPGVGDFRPPSDLGYAKGLVTQVLRKINLSNLLPKHGPGAVAGGESVVEKRSLRHSYIDLENDFRPIPYFFSLRDAAEDPRRITSRIRTQYGLSRVAFVEKDSSGPRIIGLEPAEYQWCQQALKRVLYDHLETHPLTRGHVNFTDQSVNQKLALDWRKFDTLDMSKASDRNSLELVKYLFGNTRILSFLLASRTPGTILPDGSVFLYKKFAPMGSATCFPVQALVYWALAVTALHLRGGLPLLVAMRQTFVYGDDLVIPHGYSSCIFSLFEEVFLKFNDSKCCVSGKFRESCGVDAYDGNIVTPVRFRREPGVGLPSFIPSIEHANALFEAGYRASSDALRRLLIPRLKSIGVSLPESTHYIPILHFRTERNTFRIRTRDSISRVFGWMVRPKVMAVPEEVESKCYRESLSLGSPVGSFRSRSPGVRYLAQKYSVVAQRRWVIYHGEAPFATNTSLGSQGNLGKVGSNLLSLAKLQRCN